MASFDRLIPVGYSLWSESMKPSKVYATATGQLAEFVLHGDEFHGWQVLEQAANLPRLSIPGILIDGSGTGRYKDDIISTREQQKEFAVRVLNALNGLQ